MTEPELKNARIENTSMSTADHGLLSSFIYLDYGGSGQGFGGYCLYSPKNKSNGNVAGHWIWRVMETVGVSEWKDLIGKTVRVKASHGKVHEIGHIIKDKWFNPSKEFEEMEND